MDAKKASLDANSIILKIYNKLNDTVKYDDTNIYL